MKKQKNDPTSNGINPKKIPLAIAILGFSREGRAVLSYLQKNPNYRNSQITICDQNPKIKNLIQKSYSDVLENIRIRTGKNYLKNLTQFNLIVRSPGIPYRVPEIQKARRAGVTISSATKLFFDEIRNINEPRTDTKLRTNKSSRKYPRTRLPSYHPTHSPIVVGITGTKGKGTVATLLTKMLQASGKKIVLVGNIGDPALQELERSKRADVVVIELSSFQLQDLTNSPDIAVVLDIYPDHLDSHKTFSEYVRAKSTITRYQQKNDSVFYFPKNRSTQSIAALSKGKKIPITANQFKFFKPADLKIRGNHNFQNAVIAARVAAHLGCSKNAIKKIASTFKGLSHRLELVRILRTTHYGLRTTVSFYDDSIATIPEATMAALRSFREPIILYLGGHDKGSIYGALAKKIKKSTVQGIVVFGENKEKIKSAMQMTKLPMHLFTKFKPAIHAAYQMAKKYKKAIVLLSPGATSFPYFTDYADRGNQFQKIVKEL